MGPSLGVLRLSAPLRGLLRRTGGWPATLRNCDIQEPWDAQYRVLTVEKLISAAGVRSQRSTQSAK